jgi:hypothetical protein
MRFRVNVISEKRSSGKCYSGKRVYGELCFRGNGQRGNDSRENEISGIGPQGNDNNRTIPLAIPKCYCYHVTWLLYNTPTTQRSELASVLRDARDIIYFDYQGQTIHSEYDMVLLERLNDEIKKKNGPI